MLDQVSKFLEYVKSVFAPGSEQVRAAEEAKKLWEDMYNYVSAKVAESGEVASGDGKYFRKKGDDIEEKFDSMSDAVQNSLKQEFGSAGTSLNQVARAFRVIGERGDWKEGTTNVDIGGGRFDKASEYLKDTYGVENLVFDPFNRDAESNRKIAERVRDNKVDTVTCNNVLNVIKEKESRANVILQAAKAIKEDGTAYFSVYEGNKSGEGK